MRTETINKILHFLIDHLRFGTIVVIRSKGARRGEAVPLSLSLKPAIAPRRSLR